MDLLSQNRGVKRDMRVHLNANIINPYDPLLGNINRQGVSGASVATTEDILVIRERQRELKELIRATRGGRKVEKPYEPPKSVKDRKSMILNPAMNQEENTLDRYLKEHTH